MLGSLTSQPLSINHHQMEPTPINQIGITSSVSTNPASISVVKQPEMGFTRSNLGLQTPLLPTKRKAAAEISVPNKRMVHTEAHVNSPRLSQQLGFSNKKMVRNESMSNKTVSPRVQTPKSKTVAPEVSPKLQNESYEAVRMKMRETLAAALSIGNPDRENVSDEDKSKDTGSTAGNKNLEQKGKIEGQIPQYNYIIPDTDGSFGDPLFVKDDLLQGNGLSWAWDMEVAGLEEAKMGENSNLEVKNVSGNGIEQVISCPQELVVKIEAALFKLFGGVSKKYKEKGRSLMFNLKDRNNPELREKVLSSKISPERLCSMTPEELASKELSEWRMAKAEELDKMIVLPDSDVDMRRLVKKTHKGEYQVEVDQDDDVSVEVSVGSNSLTQFQKRTKKDHLPSVSEAANVSTDATELMQELNVDEFKDEKFLPPIVSLDEFMDSLDSEPPFENLPVNVKEMKARSDKDTSEIGGKGNEKTFSGAISANNVDNELNVKKMEAERKDLSPVSAPIGECVWEGNLQLTLSSVVPVIGLFRSGEKTSAHEWPVSMEIKGRVRLEAFEKFLQELPLSRTRAVMVVHFVLKDASSEYDRASLSEVMDSYVAEERVGFGEPNQGVELYFCPPHKRITDAISRLLSKDQNDILFESAENVLIGLVVWRRAHPSSAMLPNSSSRHKHNRKHLSSRRREILNSNTNSNTRKSFNHDNDVDDDDVPPGFGPGVVAARDENDLPEFSFSKGSNSSRQTLPTQSGSGSRLPSPRPADQMRQLVHEYGQTGNNTSWNGNRVAGIETKPWNQDDDDDIPEWKPQLQNHQQLEGPNHNVIINQVRPAMGHPPTHVMPTQQPFSIMQNGWVPPPTYGSSWVQPLTPQGLPPNDVVPGQYYGGQWWQDDGRGRGF